MATRRPHALPGNKSSESPQACIWVDTETLPTALPDGSEAHHLDYGFACYRRRRGKGQWTKPEWFRFDTIDQFWCWALSKTRNKTRLYLFAHNGAFDLPVLHAFTELPERGFTISKAICDAPPMDITWKSGTQALRFVDTLNIWRMSLAALGESVGLGKLRMPPESASKARKDAYCRRDVKVIMRACLAWFDFLVDNDLGGFKGTLASQAFTSFRHRFMDEPVLIHNNRKALDLERASYVGGRTECFYLGKYTDEFYYIDVNSMYPSVMQSNPFPTCLQGVYRQPERAEIDRWRKDRGVIVECTLVTDTADYPLVDEGRLIFPVGRFNTTLAGPEFFRAYDAGHVKRMHRVAVYEMAELFRSFVDFFYNERLKAKARGDAVNTFNYKILQNSLYGKFGQLGRHFDIISTCEPNLVEITQELDGDQDKLFTRRKFGGIVQEWCDEGEAFHSFPAIASYVTSYARVMLCEAIQAAGRENCYYCDTDSLVVNRQGWESLCHLVDQDRLGAWSLCRILESIVLHGPKDYVFDGAMTVKGVRKNAVWIDGSTVDQDQFVGFRGLIRSGSLSAPIVKRIRKTQHRVYRKGTPDAAGRVHPLEISGRQTRG